MQSSNFQPSSRFFFFSCQLIAPQCRTAGKNTRLPASERRRETRRRRQTQRRESAQRESNNIKGVNTARGGGSINNKCLKARGAVKETEPGLFEIRRQRFLRSFRHHFLIKDFSNQTCFFWLKEPSSMLYLKGPILCQIPYAEKKKKIERKKHSQQPQ